MGKKLETFKKLTKDPLFPFKDRRDAFQEVIAKPFMIYLCDDEKTVLDREKGLEELRKPQYPRWFVEPQGHVHARALVSQNPKDKNKYDFHKVEVFFKSPFMTDFLRTYGSQRTSVTRNQEKLSKPFRQIFEWGRQLKMIPVALILGASWDDLG